MLATELVCGIDYGSTIFFVLDQIIIKGVIIPRRGLMLVATDAIRGIMCIQKTSRHGRDQIKNPHHLGAKNMH